MKKIIYVCLIAVLALSFGCEKEDINVNDNINKSTEELNTDLSSKSGSSSYEKSTNTNYYDENGNPVGTYYLYLDMDEIEANYTGSYTGSFSQHYYNEMSAHFTIHSVEYANSKCGNIERWVVTRPEYDNYIISIGGTLIGVIDVAHTDGGNNSSTSSGNTGGTGWGDENGNVTTTPTKKPKDPVTANTTQVPFEYQGCF